MPITDFGLHLQTYLAGAGLGLVTGTNLFRAQFPQDVIEGVLLMETGGQPSVRPHSYVIRSVQITCRSQNYTTAMNQARAIYDLLDNPPGTRLMTTSKVIYSKAFAPPANLGQDERQAFRVILNFDFHLAN